MLRFLTPAKHTILSLDTPSHPFLQGSVLTGFPSLPMRNPFLTVKKTELLYDPAFPLLGIFQKELEAGSQRLFYMTFKAAFIHNTRNLEAT